MTLSTEVGAEFAGAAFLVTGAASGIGRATCLRLARAGAGLIAVDRDEGRLAALVALCADHGSEVRAVVMDLGQAVEFAGLAEAVASTARGRLRGAVNCAAIVEPAAVLEQDAQAWDRLFAVNLRAPMQISQIVARQLITTGTAGSIVHVSSTAALIARAHLAAYAASKAALEQLAKVQAIELAAHAIRVNAVRVGLVDTEGVRAAAAGSEGQHAHGRKIARIPLGRDGAAEEVAEFIAFLLSARSGFCTGGVYPIDGGYSAGLAAGA